MKPQSLTIPQDELLRKLQSGELVVVSRENMEAMRQLMNRAEGLGMSMDIATPARETLPPKPGLRINLGSGQRPFSYSDKRPELDEECCLCGLRYRLHVTPHRFIRPGDWINVDIQPKWHPDIVADGEDLRKHFMDDSAEMVVLQHTLEHYGCGEGDAMLKECYRILRPGGSLIVTVPDMEALCKAWLKYKGYRLHMQGWQNVEDMDTQLFMTNVYGAYHGDEADRHKWVFDDVSLSATLSGAGRWKQVLQFDWREIPGADISRSWWILGWEAVK